MSTSKPPTAYLHISKTDNQKMVETSSFAEHKVQQYWNTANFFEGKKTDKL